MMRLTNENFKTLIEVADFANRLIANYDQLSNKKRLEELKAIQYSLLNALVTINYENM